VSRVIATPGVTSLCNGVAVSRDGRTLLLCNARVGDGATGVHAFSVEDGCLVRVIGGGVTVPAQVCIAPDGFVFVAECSNDRVQVLTPDTTSHGFVGEGTVRHPTGVCANADVVVVFEAAGHRMCVFRRDDRSVVTRSDSVDEPVGACFVCSGSRVAVADCRGGCVSVFFVGLRCVGSRRRHRHDPCCTASQWFPCGRHCRRRSAR
jgi:DNA-binding beta-propeller fold protein YncE